ncbi:hypothetical protein B4U78_016735 [Microbacterium esteraromaticum]|nr:hypothetical protein B4U78_016735 [Microbacterium esteraromaticum]
MFVHSAEFVKANQGDFNISIYGQEKQRLTYGLAKINLAIRGIEITNLGKPENTFTDDQHKDLKAKFILANPPFNQKN